MPSSAQEEANRRAGAAIRELRNHLGKSQEFYSFECNIDQSTLSKVERLGPQEITWAKLFALAEAMGAVVEVTFKPVTKS